MAGAAQEHDHLGVGKPRASDYDDLHYFSNTKLSAIRMARASAASSRQTTVHVLAILILNGLLSSELANQFSGRGLFCDCTSVLWFDRLWPELCGLRVKYGDAAVSLGGNVRSGSQHNTLIERTNSA
jgi:hypothetical protein